MSLISTALEAAVPLHHQDTQPFCGPACAQMIVAKVENKLVEQDQIDALFPSPKSWATTPEDLAISINYHLSDRPCRARSLKERTPCARLRGAWRRSSGRPPRS